MEKFLRLKQLKDIIGLSRSTLWRMEQEGRFPRRRRIGKAATAWLESEILTWMKARAEVR